LREYKYKDPISTSSKYHLTLTAMEEAVNKRKTLKLVKEETAMEVSRSRYSGM
jgi:hypothetical protein